MSVHGKEDVEAEIEIMEKEIVYLKGRKRRIAFNAYRKLVLHQLKEPIFLRRSEQNYRAKLADNLESLRTHIKKSNSKII